MNIHSMGVRAVIAMALLLSVAGSESPEGSVTFTGEKVSMKCPWSGTWYRRNAELGKEENWEFKYDSDSKGLYKCKYTDSDDKDDKDDKEYYFYVKGKACANCIELEASQLGLAITVDMAGTIVLMMIIYKCTKKKSSAGATNASKAPARAGGRAPPVPSPDYEALNPNTRSQDPYSSVSRTG